MIRKLEVGQVPKYMTKQRKALLRYLSQHADETLSAKQIEAALSGEGISISAVYRNLAASTKAAAARSFISTPTARIAANVSIYPVKNAAKPII